MHANKLEKVDNVIRQSCPNDSIGLELSSGLVHTFALFALQGAFIPINLVFYPHLVGYSEPSISMSHDAYVWKSGRRSSVISRYSTHSARDQRGIITFKICIGRMKVLRPSYKGRQYL
ncbi:hypothetical protein BDV29DRAFT_182292 [Aspergillus leporis]|uniref:Uncharacterized protein n=1 Tax=Aspergillus leporis TaxID=41062 RepID=A0A5N5WPP6_9EURO|nr:hypothetical protein BDV29DRAFT_182292 [Aspergillus leporis]